MNFVYLNSMGESIDTLLWGECYHVSGEGGKTFGDTLTSIL